MSELPSITPLGQTPPNRSMLEEDYVPAADAFAAWMPVVASDISGAIEWMQLTFEATNQAKTQAAQSAANAAESVEAAALAEGYKNSAEVAAAAAQAAAGLPSLIGNARRKLRVKDDETGVEWADDEVPVKVGQILLSTYNASFDKFLKLDEGTILKGAYPEFESWIASNDILDFDVLETEQSTIAGGLTVQGVTYGGSLFVAVLDSSYATTSFATSADGLSWTTQSPPISRPQGITYDGSQFIAVGYGVYTAGAMTGQSYAQACTSPDGINWTQRYNGPPSNILRGVATNGTTIVVAGNKSAVSADGINWQEIDAPGAMYAAAVAYGNGVFVAAGNSGLIWTSADGFTWESHSVENAPNLNGVAYGKGRFVIVGDGGFTATSDDGVQWTSTFIEHDSPIRGVGFALNRFILSCNSEVFTSPDGVQWLMVSAIPSMTIYAVTSSPLGAVLAGSGGQVTRVSVSSSSLQLPALAESRYSGFIKVES